MDLGHRSGRAQAKPSTPSPHFPSLLFPTSSHITMSTALPSVVYPGLALGPTSEYIPGLGTHVQTAHVYASLSGAPAVDNSTKPPTVFIPRLLSPSTSSLVPSTNVANSNTLPRVGSTVLGKVTRCMIKQINVAILIVDDRVCADEWSGVVRREDVRATEKEKVAIGESFRVGDLIRGEVVCRRPNLPIALHVPPRESDRRACYSKLILISTID